MSAATPTPGLLAVNALGLEAIDRRAGKLTTLSTALRMRPVPVPPVAPAQAPLANTNTRRRRGRRAPVTSEGAAPPARKPAVVEGPRAEDPEVCAEAALALRRTPLRQEGLVELVLGFLGQVAVPLHCPTLPAALASGARTVTLLTDVTQEGPVAVPRGARVVGEQGRLTTTAIQATGRAGKPAVIQGLALGSPDGCLEVTGSVVFRKCTFENCAVVVRAGDPATQGATAVVMEECALTAGPQFQWSHCLSVGLHASVSLVGVRVRNLISGSLTGTGQCVADAGTRFFPNPACPLAKSLDDPPPGPPGVSHRLLSLRGRPLR
mmetsp:Transcript_96071/g.256711  ORF Transcript_96071/g.256711 Transcript_96071/m.256711 type:complete len:322 (+) Transcript_96071:21-986(+)